MRVQKEGRAFSEFKETMPKFMPTYKRHVGSRTYDLSRKPAWTDRILFRTTANAYDNVSLKLEQIYYASHDNYRGSDHVPVSSLFALKVFNRSAFRAIRGLVEPLRISFLPVYDWRLHQDAEAWFTITSPPFDSAYWDPQSADDQLSEHDWIGLYRDNFGSLDENVGFAWVEPRCVLELPPHVHVEEGQEALEVEDDQPPSRARTTPRQQIWFKVTFEDQAALTADTYRLLYVSHHLSSVLGMSPPFEISA